MIARSHGRSPSMPTTLSPALRELPVNPTRARFAFVVTVATGRGADAGRVRVGRCRGIVYSDDAVEYVFSTVLRVDADERRSLSPRFSLVVDDLLTSSRQSTESIA